MSADTNAAVNRREFARIDVSLPVDVRLVGEEERSTVRSRILSRGFRTDYASLPEIKDSPLQEWLKVICTKLDQVINAITFDKDGLGCLPYRSASLSGNGLSFLSPLEYRINDFLEIKIVLNGSLPLALCLYGRVVNVDRRKDGFSTSVHLSNLDDVIRDEIVKFVFEREREIIRGKRG